MTLGAFSFALTAIKDLKDTLRSINAQCAGCKTEEERLQALNQIRGYVDLHSGLKEFSNSLVRSCSELV